MDKEQGRTSSRYTYWRYSPSLSNEVQGDFNKWKQPKRDIGKLNPEEVGRYWTIEEHKNLHQQGTRVSTYKSRSFWVSTKHWEQAVYRVRQVNQEYHDRIHESLHQKCKPECYIPQPSAIGMKHHKNDDRRQYGATPKRPGYWLHTRSYNHASHRADEYHNDTC